ncbi:homoserine/homoserine lactone efflux protein [Dechloromonas sp. HYN0024]|uniref:homoserine/homoserine lactone efflux protein n=1 Tax=Dechloromonas sp. HYN0024 TaxID=2231055 RepID=UPI000E444E03|nr:homoserine/homoserine lactone efflux protein [Dechloromonas sp. HYN0024]AXS78821.1 homoserine/homoserine lactone efflux protein [Dechloromonas sp. HYN0024]
MTLAVWLGFLLASILIAVTPGPGAVISMSTGMRHGYWAALMAILGLQTAILIHLLIVALGLGALVAASETAFSVVKFLGAAYLVWLGFQKWRAPVVPVDANAPPVLRKGLFLQGVLVNLTNPKAIIFIAALVPQFVSPGQAQVPQYLIIATTLCLTDLTVMSGYALAAVHLGRWLHDPIAIRRQNRFFGGLFVSAGALLAVSSRPI